MPKVSVVVPVYNVERYLERCVESIRNQTLQDLEIILVDDGSPDNCPAMCDKYTQLDSRIKVVHKKNAGLGMACNSGIEVASGEYIAFCDSDDWIEPEMYAKMYEVAIRHDADAVFTGLRRVDGNGKILEWMPHPSKEHVYSGCEVLRLVCDIICAEPHERFDHSIQVSAKVVLYKKSLISTNNLRFVSEREYPSEDLIFNISVLHYAKTAVVLNTCFYNYFVNDDSITTTLKEDRFDKIIRSVQLISSIVGGNNADIFSDAETRLHRFIIGEARMQARLIINSTESANRKRQLINDLSNNEHLKRAVRKYPLKMMPLKHRIMLYIILSGNYNLLKYIFKFV